jgi:hypothetical protein
MTEVLPYVFAVVLVILTALLVAVGIHLILVLRAFRQLVEKANILADQAGERILALSKPLQSLMGVAAGVKAGMRVFEGFVNFLNLKKKEKDN